YHRAVFRRTCHHPSSSALIKAAADRLVRPPAFLSLSLSLLLLPDSPCWPRGCLLGVGYSACLLQSHRVPRGACCSRPGRTPNLSPPVKGDSRSAALHSKEENVYFTMNSDMDGDAENQVEMEEKTRLINQVLELQHTLEDLSARVDAVKEENLKLKSENQVLGQYIENLMSASSVFQTTDTKSKRK
uniref:Short coiled-coil protein a n=2 Tax=Erpetoichthys calabaricus TaxID=27687 RepID=A0A8C4RGJ3_ERPCA